jgi:hypothetical protein
MPLMLILTAIVKLSIKTATTNGALLLLITVVYGKMALPSENQKLLFKDGTYSVLSLW